MAPDTTAAAQIVETDDKIGKLIEKHMTHMPCGIVVSDKVTFEEWMEMNAFYSGLRDHTSWFYGDFLRAGERFGERYAQAVDMFGKSYSTLTSIVYVCSRFSDLERRHADLPFEWHAAVAALLPQQADAILNEAKRKRAIWNRDDIRDAAAKAKGLPTRAQKLADKEEKKNSVVMLLVDSHTAMADLVVQSTVTPVTPETTQQPQDAPAIAQVTPPSPATVPQAQTQPAVPAKPAGPAPTEIEPDQNLALERAEAALNQFVEASKAVDWKAVQKLAAQRWLRMLIPADELIDVLQKKL